MSDYAVPVDTAARAEAMRRARQGTQDAQYAPYAGEGSVLDRLSALLPSWMSGRSAVMQQRDRLRKMDEQTAPENNR